ncbi:MAG: asparagine synthase (glutamine-hydrolyzing) [Burkholderiales bacterium]|nr:asparagine synthase (glutamine-hydrolyzing) [Phycisphaerae bacterium]
MCGIAGIVGRVNDAHCAALERMGIAMNHRGPDGSGTWIGEPDASGRGCMLIHRRLSILDLTASASQPMVDPVTGQVIVFNGEIYNYRDLRSSLERSGQQFQSTGDTAVLLRTLGLGGIEAATELRGMFALALWDPQSRELTLARDPHGIKPLYYCFARDVGVGDGGGDWSLMFASEVRTLLASGLIPSPSVDPASVASIVWNGFVTAPNTIVKGIQTLWPGEYLVLARGGAVKTRKTYWRVPVAGAADGDAASFSSALGDSVSDHLCSDVPLGVFLSSGVDSSAVANHAQRTSQTAINTFTLAFDESEFNEGVWARKIAGAIGTEHHELVLTESMFMASLDKACDALDQPSFDGINSYFMSKAVRDAGLVVALVGTGGDELFGGYRTFAEVPRLLRMARRSGFVPRSVKQFSANLLSRLLAGSRAGVGPQTRWAKLPAMVEADTDVLALYQLAYALFLPGFQRQLLADGIPALPHGLQPDMESRLREEIRGADTLAAISCLEQRLFLGERLLRDADAASMAVSIETRLPLVDCTLTAAAARLPSGDRFDPIGRKQMLRQTGLAGLDPQLFDRPKTGFVIPFDRWIKAGLGKAMDELMRDPKAAANAGLNGRTVTRLWDAYLAGQPGMYWSRVWAIYMLIRWCERTGLRV